MKRSSYLGWVLLVLLPAAALSQPRPQPQPDPLQQFTFPPELVMKNQKKIGLTAAQIQKLKAAVREAQGRFTELQWDLEAKMEDFVELLRQDQIDEQKAMAAFQEVIGLENEIKKTQIQLAIRIKNVLTKKQEEQLRKLRSGMEKPPSPPFPPPPRGGQSREPLEK